MSLNFGQSLFPPRGEILANYDWKNFLTGNGYITFYGGFSMSPQQVYESYTTGKDSYFGINLSADKAAQTFTIGNTGTNENFYITKVRLFCEQSGGNSTAHVSIQAVDGSNKPDGTDIITFKDVILTNTSPYWVDFDINTAKKDTFTKLSAGTMYAIVVSHTGYDIRLWKDGSAATYTGGNSLTSADSGANWTADTDDDFLFEVWGTTKNYTTLSPEKFRSDPIASTISKTTTAGDDYESLNNWEFFASVQKVGIISGYAFVNFKINPGTTKPVYFEVEIYHTKGTTTTKIGNATTSSATDTTILSIIIPMTQTRINKDDKISLKLIGYVNPRLSATASDYVLSHDPTATDGTELKLDLPFKTEL